MTKIFCPECSEGVLQLLNDDVFSCPKCDCRFTLSFVRGWGKYK